MKRAFALIEVLVVIAIIAILFPVFAQAKLAAKKTAALNSVKEIALAMSVDDPTKLAAFGDEYNGRRYTISAVGSDLEYYTGPRQNSALRYGGSFKFGFCDGHAKALRVSGYTFNPVSPVPGEGYIMMPADTSIWHNFWCSQASVPVQLSNLPGLGQVPNMPCSQFIDLAMSGGLGIPVVQWPN